MILNPDSLRNFRCALPSELVGVATFSSTFIFQSDIPCANDDGNYVNPGQEYEDVFVTRYNLNATQLGYLDDLSTLTCGTFPAGSLYFGVMLATEVVSNKHETFI